MIEIKFWKDETNKTMEPTLFSEKAEALAKAIAAEHEGSKGRKANKRTQIRKFYDEVVRLTMEAKTQKWETVLPLVHMLIAKAAYANGRELISDNFLAFIRNSVAQVKNQEDLDAFSHFFEAFMGFYRMHGPSN